jgi:uncharacterized protein
MSTTDTPTPAPVKKRRGWRYRVARLILSILFIYTAVCVGISLYQDKLMFPGSVTQGNADYELRPSRSQEREIIDLKLADGTPIKLAFAPTIYADASKSPTILFFYGNGNTLQSAWHTPDGWRGYGANACAIEYPGYGMSGGKPGEKQMYAAADAAYEYLRSRPGVDRDKIIVAGWSLGAAVAIDLASRKPVAGLITMSAFTSMTDMAQRLYWFLPVRLLVRHRFESLRKIPDVTCAALIMHGRDDSFIPWTMSERLAKNSSGPVTTVFFKGFDHNEAWQGGEGVDDAVEKFIRQIAKR